MAFVFQHLRLYNNAAKIFGTEGVLRRRFAVLEDKMVYTKRGKCSIYWLSRVGVFFFENSFRVPKIVPKVVPKIISALALKIIIFI